MGCICSKGTAEEIGTGNNDNDNDNEKEIEVDKSTVQLIAPSITKKEDIEAEIVRKEGSSARPAKSKPNAGNGITVPLQEQKFDKKTIQGHHQRRATFDSASSGDKPIIPKATPALEGDLNSAGWPQWLTEAAPEAIKGWVPRRADTFEKLEKIGQGTYSSVYRAHDLETGKIVAMKKVRFVNMDPESVRFMAREIHILRKLDHPNVMKLEAIVTSRMSGSLYLVFEYMEHDLAGLAAIPGIKFTEQQIKCYMLQLFQGLEHCHSRGILHRDIKGSNLLVSDDGVLKIGDFGLATAFHPGQKQALTSRVVTLWYRAPELLLGATQYGVAIDMWSAGCILAELFAGKPIMPGRTEVEQMHKIFKLCGSPSEDYWRKTKLPHATSFKPQQSYDRRIIETFKNFPPSALVLVDKLLAMEPEGRGSAALALRSEFFTTEPLPAESSSLPKYPPCKELDAKVRQEEARRQKAETVRRRGPESVRISSRNAKKVPTPEFTTQGQPKTSSSYKYDQQEDAGSGFRIEPPRGGAKNSNLSYCTSMIHPSATGSSKNSSYARNKSELRTQQSHMAQTVVDRAGSCLKKDEPMLSKDSSIGYAPKKTRIHYSGPLMPPGGNMEEILREHERQIQQAVRKARVEKSGTRNNLEGYNSQQHQGLYRG